MVMLFESTKVTSLRVRIAVLPFVSVWEYSQLRIAKKYAPISKSAWAWRRGLEECLA